MVKQQCNNITMAQVSMDTQQGGIAEGISAVIHISPTHNQQPAYLDTERSELQSICDFRCVCAVCYLDVGSVEVTQR